MTYWPVAVIRMLIISLTLAVPSVQATGYGESSTRTGNAFTGALLPGFVRPSLQNWVFGFVEAGDRHDPRFMLKPVRESAGGDGALQEPVSVDNLLRFQF